MLSGTITDLLARGEKVADFPAAPIVYGDACGRPTTHRIARSDSKETSTTCAFHSIGWRMNTTSRWKVAEGQHIITEHQSPLHLGEK